MKDKAIAYLLWFGFLIGLCGLHRLYIGKIDTGLLWLFTYGLFGIGQIVDVFTLGSQVDIANLQRGAGPAPSLSDSREAGSATKHASIQSRSNPGVEENRAQMHEALRTNRIFYINTDDLKILRDLGASGISHRALERVSQAETERAGGPQAEALRLYQSWPTHFQTSWAERVAIRMARETLPMALATLGELVEEVFHSTDLTRVAELIERCQRVQSLDDARSATEEAGTAVDALGATLGADGVPLYVLKAVQAVSDVAFLIGQTLSDPRPGMGICSMGQRLSMASPRAAEVAPPWDWDGRVRLFETSAQILYDEAQAV